MVGDFGGAASLVLELPAPKDQEYRVDAGRGVRVAVPPLGDLPVPDPADNRQSLNFHMGFWN